MTLDDAKTIGIIGSLLVSSIALFLNFYSTRRSIKSQKISNYQEIVKSHRDLWKLSLDKPAVYRRIFEARVDLTNEPITYEERLFTRLLFLHMSSAYSFAKYSHILPIEKLELDFSGVLVAPIPRIVWEKERQYQNSEFMKFVEGANKPRGIKRLIIKIWGIPEMVYSKLWRVLILSASPDGIKETIIALGDDVICHTDQDDEITPSFIKKQKIDCIICFGYGRLLTRAVTKAVPCINIHGGYLPHNRGPNPNLWAWINDTPKGVSIHYIDSGIDTGDIIAQKKIEILEPITLKSSFDQTVAECKRLFAAEWPSIRSGVAKRIKQGGKGTFHTLQSQEDLANLLEKGGLDIPIAEFCQEAKTILARKV